MLSLSAPSRQLLLQPAVLCCSRACLRNKGRTTSTSARVSRELSRFTVPESGEEMGHQFRILSEEKVYSRYLTVYDRTIQFKAKASGETQDVHFDVVGHPRANFMFTVVLPFHTSNNGTGPQVTLIREYCQGPNCMGYAIPGGCFDEKKHDTFVDCAKAELSEEAHLLGGELIRLIPDDHPGMSEGKWSVNRFVPYLAIDPQPDPSPGRRDEEEVMQQPVRVSVEQLEAIIANGEMMLPSIATWHLAANVLRSRGLLS